MNSIELNRAFQYIEDEYLDIAEQERIQEEQRGMRTGGFFWIAACVLLAFAVPVAAASGWFGLHSLLIPSEEEQPASGGMSVSGDSSASGMPSGAGEGAFVSGGDSGMGQPDPGRTETGGQAEAPGNGQHNMQAPGGGDLIGLSGYQGSVEMRALTEWQIFLENYDIEGAIEESKDTPFDEEKLCVGYQVHNQEMADKLREIAEKYGLKLHMELSDVSPEELALCVGGEFMTEEFRRYWGYIYEDGSFQFDGEFEPEGVGAVDFQLRRVVKGTLDEVILNIGDVSEYRELQYVTECGEIVMLELGSDKSLIYADFDSCFLVMNIMEGSGSGITEEILKETADAIDFTILKNVR